MMRTVLVLSVLTAALAACSNEPTHDVKFYLEHPQERAAKVADCKNNPGEKRLEPNCKNAMEAEHQASFKGDGMPTIK